MRRRRAARKLSSALLVREVLSHRQPRRPDARFFRNYGRIGIIAAAGLVLCNHGSHVLECVVDIGDKQVKVTKCYTKTVNSWLVTQRRYNTESGILSCVSLNVVATSIKCGNGHLFCQECVEERHAAGKRRLV